jgi:hypothetical protein
MLSSASASSSAAILRLPTAAVVALLADEDVPTERTEPGAEPRTGSFLAGAPLLVPAAADRNGL